MIRQLLFVNDKYFILLNSDPMGPYSKEDLSGLLSDGVITRSTPLKANGRDSWLTVGDVMPEHGSSGPRHAPLPPLSSGAVATQPSQVSNPPVIQPESVVVHVSRDGQQFGPYKMSDVQGYLMSGDLHPDDMGWHEGLTEWVQLRVLINLKPNNNPASPTQPTLGPTNAKSGITATAQRYAVNKSNRLYSPDQIGIAAFFGSPVAACWCLASNYRQLGNPEAATRWLICGGVFLVCWFFMCLVRMSPGWFLVWLIFGIAHPFGFKGYANRTQGDAVLEHVGAGGQLVSTWFVVCISLVILVCFIGLLTVTLAPL